MQCKDIPTMPILRFLKDHEGHWTTWGKGYSMPTVAEAMPEGTPPKLQLAKMKQLIKSGLASGCYCGCRGDFEITLDGELELDPDSMINDMTTKTNKSFT